MRARDEARSTGVYFDAEAVVAGLQRKLDAARIKAAKDDLERLFDFILERELARGGELDPSCANCLFLSGGRSDIG